MFAICLQQCKLIYHEVRTEPIASNTERSEEDEFIRNFGAMEDEDATETAARTIYEYTGVRARQNARDPLLRQYQSRSNLTRRARQAESLRWQDGLSRAIQEEIALLEQNGEAEVRPRG